MPEKYGPMRKRAGLKLSSTRCTKKGELRPYEPAPVVLADDTRTTIVLDVDQPRPRIVIHRLLEAHHTGSNLITVPTFQGKRGHPTVLDGWLLSELRKVRERTKGLRELVERYHESVVEVPFESEVVLLDLNTKKDYEKARATYFEQAAQ